MNNYTSNSLTCSVYGHNLERSNMPSEAAHKLICKTCHAEIQVNDYGEFDAHPIKNKRLISALKSYFTLKNNPIHRQLSY